MSKVALNIAGKSLAIDLNPRGIAVAILHGLVRTGMIRFNPGIDPADAVQGLLARIDALTMRPVVFACQRAAVAMVSRFEGFCGF